MILKDYPSTQRINFFLILSICNLKFDLFPRRNFFKKKFNLILENNKHKTNNKNTVSEFKIIKNFYKI